MGHLAITLVLIVVFVAMCVGACYAIWRLMRDGD